MSEPHEKSIGTVPNRGGRPRIAAERLVPVTTWVPESVAHEIDRQASRLDRSTSEVVRRCVFLQLRRVE